MSTQKIEPLSLPKALIPILILVALLAYNVFVFGDEALDGSNQFILLIGAAVGVFVGIRNHRSWDSIFQGIVNNIKASTGAILILLMVGALAGTWMVSGIIPLLIYYGMQILNAKIFLVACVIICAIVSIATGSSWTTSATIGIALIGIAKALGISEAMTAGAVISGAYFGDKLSPMSDTTNLAPAMAGTDLFTHIRYMTYTTVPSIIITLVVFLFIGLFSASDGAVNIDDLKNALSNRFNLTPILLLVPVAVIFMVVKKVQPLIALFTGVLLAALCAVIFQPDLIREISGINATGIKAMYRGVMNAITVDVSIATESEIFNSLLSSGGMNGMLGTIWLIVCAMCFGGVMEAIGALKTISASLLKLSSGIFGLFASTSASCVVMNATASDQYLAIVVPGKMYADAFKEKNLAPENLSRTLEDSGTVTSVLIPYNTCGAYQSKVLGVSVTDYFVYAIFNWISPLMTLTFAALDYKIRRLK